MKHAPSPWRIDTTPSGTFILTTVTLSPPIAIICEHGWYEACKANADLICAAPELLEVLEDLFTYYEGRKFSEHVTHPLYHAGRIIAKAKGE